jgi:hypothetical protein
VPGHQRHLAFRIDGANLPHHIQPTDFGHAQVDEGEIRLELPERRQRLAPAVVLRDVEPELRSETLDQRQDRRLVVDDEQRWLVRQRVTQGLNCSSR